jgi:hypothetical protein
MSYHDTAFPRSQLAAAGKNIYGLVISDGDSDLEGRELMTIFNQDNRALDLLRDEYFVKRVDFLHIPRDTTDCKFKRYLDEKNDFLVSDYSMIHRSSGKKSWPSKSENQSSGSQRSPNTPSKAKASSKNIREFNSDKPCNPKMKIQSESSSDEDHFDFGNKRPYLY